MSEHSARFDDEARSAAVGVSTVLRPNGRPMRQLVATQDLPPGVRVAAYPCEVVSDDQEFDDAYAVRIYQEAWQGGRIVRRQCDGLSGVPTPKSLARASIDGLPTVAMFANEPNASGAPTCRFVFPTTRRGAPRAAHTDTRQLGR